MTLTGKGIFIWQIQNCNGGDVNKTVEQIKAGGFSHVLVKIADGITRFSVATAPKLVTALKVIGVQVWGWHYVYGYSPIVEAQVGAARIKELALDGYVIDAETEYKQSGPAAATEYMKELHGQLKNTPIALSSFRWPSVHPEFPWQAFYDRGIDISMPQVYWLPYYEGKRPLSAGEQLTKSYNEFKKLAPNSVYIPTGAAYHENSWQPNASEIPDFATTAQKLGCPAINFWEFANSQTYGLFGYVANINYCGSLVVNPTVPAPGSDDLTLLEKIVSLQTRVAALEAKMELHKL